MFILRDLYIFVHKNLRYEKNSTIYSLFIDGNLH
jgi:hypothetical protein